jgi:hypothetical protein
MTGCAGGGLRPCRRVSGNGGMRPGRRRARHHPCCRRGPPVGGRDTPLQRVVVQSRRSRRSERFAPRGVGRKTGFRPTAADSGRLARRGLTARRDFMQR